MLDTIFSYPVTYPAAIIIALALIAEIAVQPNIAWRVPALVTIGTIFAWYLVEPVYTPDQFLPFSQDDMSTGFMAVIIFLVGFRIMVQLMAGGLSARMPRSATGVSPDIARRLLFACASVWVVLLTIGASRSGWDMSATLFPNGRAGTSMWARAQLADSGGDTFVAVAGYVYILLLAIFGILLVFVQGVALRALCVALIVISWPYAFLLGSRNTALAVVAPGFLAFILYGRAPLLVKFVITVVIYLAIDQAFRIIIAYRNIGFDHLGEIDVENVTHAGLNMSSEMMNIVGFLRTGVLGLQYGYGYLVDFSQLIPRAIWPDKPMIGIDYAIARGFASASSESGASATVSLGMIGDGVRQFGPIFGPLAPAFLMAGWVRILTQLRVDNRVSRICLYLLGLGLTFNLGRDITLLILWPFVFAYAGVIAYERIVGTKRPAIA